MHGYRDDPITVADLARFTGIGGRTIRQIISDYDGELFVVCGGQHGYYVAQDATDAALATKRLANQVKAMRKRLARRLKYSRLTWPAEQA
jgi:hypothetical protein